MVAWNDTLHVSSAVGPDVDTFLTMLCTSLSQLIGSTLALEYMRAGALHIIADKRALTFA